jgi:diacylglycerol kinase family enzyme
MDAGGKYIGRGGFPLVNQLLDDPRRAQRVVALQVNDECGRLSLLTYGIPAALCTAAAGFGCHDGGYACAVAEELRDNAKKANYALIAAKGLLYAYAPIAATVYIDGTEYHYKHTWLASTMNGRFFGGGLMCAPDQDRTNHEKKLTFVLANTRSRLSLIPVFLGVFSGKHVKHKKSVAIHKGLDITVEFSRPTTLQIDGEVILNVTKYRAYSKVPVKTR